MACFTVTRSSFVCLTFTLLSLVLTIAGCGQKIDSIENSQQLIDIEKLNTNTNNPEAVIAKAYGHLLHLETKKFSDLLTGQAKYEFSNEMSVTKLNNLITQSPHIDIANKVSSNNETSFSVLSNKKAILQIKVECHEEGATGSISETITSETICRISQIQRL